jgi:two-component system, OmpR family, response regulator QseB
VRILIVEDDATLANGLTVGLRLSGFTPELVETCADAKAALSQGGFAAVVLDILLPDGSGLDILSGMREEHDATPTLLLTALDQIRDRIAGLDLGADDYLGKPFDLDEVAARLRSIVRRSEGRAQARLEWNGLSVDPARMSGSLGGQDISFSPREFVILRALLERPGAILSKSTLEERLYGWQEGVESNAVEVHVHNLRAKLGASFIETVRGAGYKVRKEVV